MLWALVQPVALAGLVVAFVTAILLRGVVQRLVLARVGGQRGVRQVWDPKHDFDIFGIVAAVLGGTGWGHRAPTGFGQRSRAAVLLAGPVAVLIASQLGFAAYRAALGPVPKLYALSDVLHGAPDDSLLSQFLLAFAVELLAFGLIALVPLPPADGWGLLAARAGVRPSHGFARAQHWLDEQNVGIVLLLIGVALPIGAGAPPALLFILDVLTRPIFLLWGAA